MPSEHLWDTLKGTNFKEGLGGKEISSADQTLLEGDSLLTQEIQWFNLWLAHRRITEEILKICGQSHYFYLNCLYLQLNMWPWDLKLHIMNFITHSSIMSNVLPSAPSSNGNWYTELDLIKFWRHKRGLILQFYPSILV